MTLDEKRQAARKMRAKGQKFREIAAAFGVSTPTAYRWAADPEYEQLFREQSRQWKARNPGRVCEYNRAYDRAHRATCSTCGALCGAGSRAGASRCVACVAAAVDARRQQVVRWWADGLSMRDIAARIGWTSGALGTEMVRMRKAGYDLPYRCKRVLA